MLSIPVQRPKRKNIRKTKGQVHIEEERNSEPSASGRSKLRARNATGSDSRSKMLESDIAPLSRQRLRQRAKIRLEDSCVRKLETQTLDMTRTQRVFLLHLVDRLLRQNSEDAEPFAEHVDTVAEDVPTYHRVIERAMDLRTLRENLGRRYYSAVEDFEADFKLIIENSIRFNGLTHKISQQGLRLFGAFNILMTSLPGRN